MSGQNSRTLLKFYYQNTRWALLRLLGRGRIHRSEAYVSDAYERAYRDEPYGDTSADLSRDRKVFRDGRLEYASAIEYKSFLLELFSNELMASGARSMLELGSGRGVFTLALAALHPELEIIRGIELTPSGVRTAEHFLTEPPLELLAKLTKISPAVIQSRLSGRDIRFITGSIRQLPFADREFDFVFSNSVIEQIADDYLDVFREAARVTRTTACFSEPFREAQRNFFQRLHLANIDYFRASYHEVERAGFAITRFTVPAFQKFEFSTGFLVAAPTTPKEPKAI